MQQVTPMVTSPHETGEEAFRKGQGWTKAKAVQGDARGMSYLYPDVSHTFRYSVGTASDLPQNPYR